MQPLIAIERISASGQRIVSAAFPGVAFIIGTSRANPGKGIDCPEDLGDAEKTTRLRNVYSALVDMEIDALVSIGGDDTLKTANLLYEYQKRLPSYPTAPTVRT